MYGHVFDDDGCSRLLESIVFWSLFPPSGPSFLFSSMLSRPRQSSPPHRAMSSSSTPVAGIVAYPFPRFSSAPQTPHCISVESRTSPESHIIKRTEKSRRHAVRWIVFALGLLSIFLFFWMRSTVREPRQTDRIPFNTNDVEKHVLPVHDSRLRI